MARETIAHVLSRDGDRFIVAVSGQTDRVRNLRRSGCGPLLLCACEAQV